ncbi:MAG: GtrA family protein [Clostridiales bacterium]|nr:GtrA family protein [Clostridiales bacterium]
MEEKQNKPSLLKRFFSPEIVRLIRFTLIGGVNTAVDYGVFFLLHTLLHVGSLISQVISFSSGVVCSYFLNRRFTFKAKNKMSTAEVIKFIILNLIAMGSSVLVVWVFETYFHISPYIAKLASMLVSFTINYVGNRFFIFKAEVDNQTQNNHNPTQE